MKGTSLLVVILFAVVIAVIAVVILKSLGYDNTTVTAGAIAGGAAGAISGIFLKKKKLK
ncbi:MAG: hypothetical protein HKN90_09930 [Flavobacteriaceae bacterium]|nr:hypothetical protein [Flavobacteriaceae bacterium]